MMNNHPGLTSLAITFSSLIAILTLFMGLDLILKSDSLFLENSIKFYFYGTFLWATLHSLYGLGMAGFLFYQKGISSFHWLNSGAFILGLVCFGTLLYILIKYLTMKLGPAVL